MEQASPASSVTRRTQTVATAPGQSCTELVAVHSELTVHGSTFIHIEPQSHSLTWCVLPSDPNQRDTVVRANDFVIITSPDGEELFRGDIHPTFFVSNPPEVHNEVGGRKPPPTGFKIYWTPQGIDPHRWASLFDGGNVVYLHRHTSALLPAA